ncbi:MAG: alpha-E domain-containing protein, partial [Candidatus Sulfotelmatobacter sp.]
VLLDAYFVADKHADDLDWVGLLSSCTAFEAYCKACTAELKPERIANFLLLKPEFPYSVRYSLDRMHEALTAIRDLSLSRRTEKIERLIGRLRSMVAYVQVNEILAGMHKYLLAIIDQCRELHAAVNELYIEYPIEVAFQN